MCARLDDVDPLGDLQLARALQVGGVSTDKLLSVDVADCNSRHLRRGKMVADEWDGRRDGQMGPAIIRL